MNEIVLRNCSKIYDSGDVGLSDVSISLPRIGVVLLKGNSGSGKTTFINCLSGLDSFSNGDIIYNGEKVKSLFNSSSFLFQENYFIESLSVIDNLKLVSSKKTQAPIILLKEIGLENKANKIVSELSGGERFRIAFIRAFLQEKPIIFLDEPFANLDKENVDSLSNIIKKHSSDKLFIISTHQSSPLDNEAKVEILVDDNHCITTNVNDALLNDAVVSEKQFSGTNYTSKHSNYPFLFKYSGTLFKRNFIKNFFSLIITCISFFVIFTLLSFTLKDDSYIEYSSFVVNGSQDVAFRLNDNENKGNTISVSKSCISLMNPDYVKFSFFSFALKTTEGLNFFDEIRLYSNQNFKTVVYSPEYTETNYTYNGQNIEVSQNLPGTNRVLCVNQTIYDLIKGNIYLNNEIGVVLDDNGSFTSCPIYNTLSSRNALYSDQIIKGLLPTNDDEIVVPKRIIETIGYSDSTILDKNVTFTFRNISQYQGIENNIMSYNFKVTGISEDFVFLNEKMTNSFLECFGSNSLENSDKTIVFENYTYSTFKEAKNNNLVHIGDLSTKIYSALGLSNNLYPFIVALASLLSVLALFSIINSLYTSIAKAKKEIGILMCFLENKAGVSAPFIFETLSVSTIAVLASIPFSLIAIYLINFAFSKGFNVSITIVSFHPLAILIALSILLIFILFTSTITFLKIGKKSKISILKEANNSH